MKFKILKGTKAYAKFVALHAERNRCIAEARKVAKKVGAKQWHWAWWAVAGGISAFVFKEKPEGWGNAYTPHEEGCFMPKKNLKANKELLAEIKALPVVEEEAINSIIKYDSDKHCTTRRKMFHPGYSMHEGYVLLSFSACVDAYKPIKDVIEITNTEYNKLKKAKEI